MACRYRQSFVAGRAASVTVGVPPGRLREVVLEDAQRVGRRAAGAAVQYRRHVDIYGVVGAVRAHLPH